MNYFWIRFPNEFVFVIRTIFVSLALLRCMRDGWHICSLSYLTNKYYYQVFWPESRSFDLISKFFSPTSVIIGFLLQCPLSSFLSCIICQLNSPLQVLEVLFRFPSLTSYNRQFLLWMRPTQLYFLGIHFPSSIFLKTLSSVVLPILFFLSSSSVSY